MERQVFWWLELGGKAEGYGKPSSPTERHRKLVSTKMNKRALWTEAAINGEASQESWGQFFPKPDRLYDL